MDRKINEIYNLMYSDVITPYNLLENIYLDHYTQVNFTKHKDEIVCELKCIVDEVEEVYNYYFDNNKLSKIITYEDGKELVLFDREDELKKAIDGYKILSKQERSSVI